MNQKPIVFLASTQADLVLERKSVLSFLEKNNIDFSAMEVFGARHDKTLAVCLDEVNKCDIFILIVGFCYGDKAPGRKFSFTELEYKEAYKKKKKCLVYIKSDDVPVLPAHIEIDPFAQKALASFKKLLMKNHTVELFYNVEDLTVAIKNDLKRSISEYAREIKKIIKNENAEDSTQKISKKEEDFSFWFNAFKETYLINYGIELFYLENAVSDVNSYYWELISEKVRPYSRSPFTIDRHKMMSTTEMAVMFVLPIRHKDQYTKLKLNASLAMFCAKQILLTFLDGRINVTGPESFNREHHAWLQVVSREGYPIFSNAATWFLFEELCKKN